MFVRDRLDQLHLYTYATQRLVCCAALEVSVAGARYTIAPSTKTRKMTCFDPVLLLPPISRHALSIVIIIKGMSPDQSSETWSRF